MIRGGKPELETQHGKLLLDSGAAETWGWGTVAGKERVKRRAEWLRTSCDIKRGSRVLECGCGTGIFTRQLALTGADITAVDISPELLAQARNECPDPNVSFLEDNLERPTALQDNFFDVLCGISVLHHLAMPQALIALRGKLSPGAAFAFTEPNILNPLNKYYYYVDDIEKRKLRGTSPTEMAFTPNELKSLFDEAGYVVTSIHCRDFMHPAIPHVAIPFFRLVGSILESIPLVRNISGSLWIQGYVP